MPLIKGHMLVLSGTCRGCPHSVMVTIFCMEQVGIRPLCQNNATDCNVTHDPGLQSDCSPQQVIKQINYS